MRTGLYKYTNADNRVLLYVWEDRDIHTNYRARNASTMRDVYADATSRIYHSIKGMRVDNQHLDHMTFALPAGLVRGE